jgi:hypothetical protein
MLIVGPSSTDLSIVGSSGIMFSADHGELAGNGVGMGSPPNLTPLLRRRCSNVK